ncbi:MAG: hypothetical protein KBT87_06110 [Gammaproteobacteria bacterium]|nr:hypothetical protein [Gammaproteobacteria bacterium]MBQ0774228.1 hypothetical protein [Gammaproteobacteria bacterium]|tara:strand:- start:123447 stop:123731 length:285 start_codon:yes stop_codon:yes gene_type:complete
MEFLWLIAIIVIAVLGLTLHTTQRERHYHLPEEEVLRSVDAMHKYGHDQEAVYLLLEYSSYYPNSEPLREKLRQSEMLCQQSYRLHGHPKARQE